MKHDKQKSRGNYGISKEKMDEASGIAVNVLRNTFEINHHKFNIQAVRKMYLRAID